MKARSRYPLLLFVASAFAASAVVADDAHPAEASAPASSSPPADRAENASPAVTAAASMAVLRERMREMRLTGDPDRRMQLMEAQMNQLDDVLRSLDGTCPTPDVAPGMMGMNGRRAGAMGSEDMIARRIEMMEKRMDMMQMMLQKNAAASEPDADTGR